MSDLSDASRKPRDDEMDVFGISHMGKVRKENQDHFLIATIHKRVAVVGTNLDIANRIPKEEQRLAYLAMVADGVGGGVGGGDASATAVEAVMQYVDNSVAVYYGGETDADRFMQLLKDAAMRAHEAVRARRELHNARGTMATTLTMYIGLWPNTYVLQVGDSRYYVWRNGTLTQLTRDQTVAQELIDQGVLTAQVAARTPMANVLSSALGSDTTKPIVTRLQADWSNVHLMCSDGLTKHVSDERIGEVLSKMTSAKQACEQLLQDALDGGGTDNITIVIGRALRRDVEVGSGQ